LERWKDNDILRNVAQFFVIIVIDVIGSTVVALVDKCV
jgi:hypothetical protein